MKWKDTGDGETPNPEKRDPYDEDESYAPFEEKNVKKTTIFSTIPGRYLYWGIGLTIVFFVVLMVLIFFSTIKGPASQTQVSELQQKIEQLEQRLEKYDNVDGKVTRIWEQAKSFETFKTRFDRSEASMSLRMDHLAMSLDALQKKTDKTLKKVGKLEKVSASSVAPVRSTPVKKAVKAKTHTVAAGDTLYNISRRYNLSVEKLRSINKLTEKAVIHVGQTLIVSPANN